VMVACCRGGGSVALVLAAAASSATRNQWSLCNRRCSGVGSSLRGVVSPSGAGGWIAGLELGVTVAAADRLSAVASWPKGVSRSVVVLPAGAGLGADRRRWLCVT